MQAVIFDLDGVIVSTDQYHFLAWKAMADEEGIYFDERINERLRGIGRMESLEIILEQAHKSYTEAEKLELTQRKNQYYVNFLKENLTPDDILPGVVSLLRELKSLNVKVAIGSSSKNTPLILDKIQLTSCFDVIVDGNQISRTKPDPEVFELAARKLVVEPRHCVVVEDAEAGIAAALACGMRPVGVGAASNLNHLFLGVNSLADIQAKDLLADTLREKKGSNNLANDEGVST